MYPRESSPLASATPITSTQSTSFNFRSTQQPPVKKQKMSITQTYYLAHTARGKLSSEAARGDHDLRLLVGHANLLDSLMLELQDAEREQEAWFNETIKQSSEPRRVQWIDAIAEEAEAEDEADSESDSDAEDYASDDEEEMKAVARITRSKSPIPEITILDDAEIDEDVDMEELQLVRTSSHSAAGSPPELISDDSSDEESDDASSPTNVLPADLQRHGIKSRDFAAAAAAASTSRSTKTAFVPQQPAVVMDDGLHQQPQLVAAY